MFSYFRNRKAFHAQALSLVATVSERLTPAASSQLHRAGTRKKAVSSVQTIASRAAAFAQAHQMSSLAKASFANRIKWGVRDLGYSEEFVDMVTVAVVMSISMPKDKGQARG